MLKEVKESPFRSTKITITYGPSIADYNILKECFKAGADILRYNFSHGNESEFGEVVEKVERIERELKRYIPILADLQGPKFRVDILDLPYRDIETGDFVKIYFKDVKGSGSIYIDYEDLGKSLKRGNKIYIEDGKIRLTVEEINENYVKCKVIKGGRVLKKKGINFPDVALKLPSLTEKDKKDVKSALKFRVDYFCLSFVRSKKDVEELKNICEDVKVVSKIEKPQALSNIEGIIDISDGIMVARGDLGIEVEIEKIGIIQKEIIRKCRRRRKPVIIATQMLESMINSLIPTRAEATDITNGVLDGADSLMLSGETSVGKYPVETIKVMDRIIGFSQRYEDRRKYISTFHPVELVETISHSAALAMSDLKIEKCVIFTISGNTASVISHFHPYAEIFAFSPDPRVCREINLFYGVRSFYLPIFKNSDEMIKSGLDILLGEGLLKKGDRIIILCGNVENLSVTNIMRIAEI